MDSDPNAVDAYTYIYEDGNGKSALIYAASKGHEACVRVLIAANAKATYPDSNGWTALHVAAINGHASTCRVLIDEGASLTAVDRYNGQTPLEVAKAHGHAECVAILEAAGAVLPPAVAAAYAFVDEHIATTRGFRFAVTKTANEQALDGLDKQIYDAAKEGKLDELLDLCQQYSGHKVINSFTYIHEVGTNALIIAANRGHEACVRILIAAAATKAYTNKCSRDGRTALHWAAHNSHASTCRALVDEGASLTAVDRDGRTPLEVAKTRIHAECVAILEMPAAAAAAAAVRGSV